MPRYNHSGSAVVTRLQTAMTPGGPASITVESVTNWPSTNFWIVIDRGTTSEEKILVGSRTSTTLSSLQRGGDGGSAVSHAVGAVVEHVFTGVEADQANEHVNLAAGVHGLGVGDPVIGESHLTAHAALTQGAHGVTAPAVLAPVWPGVMWDWGGASAPAMWLLCDGSAVSRSVYADLFAAIGTTYGAGDGSTTFNVPNYTDRVARYGTPGATGGADSDSVTLSENNLPSHTHTSAAHTHTGPAHTHSINHDHPAGTTSSDTHTHTLDMSGSTAGDSVNDVLKAGPTVNTNSSAVGSDSHTHSFNVAAYSGTSGSSGTGATGSTTPDPTGATGSGVAFTVDTVPTFTGAHKIIFAGV